MTRAGENNANAKLTAGQVRELRALWTRRGENGFSLRYLARRFGVGKSTVHLAVHRVTWREV